MAIVPAPLVQTPEPGRIRYGLLRAASGPLDLASPGGRGGGARYVPVTCGVAHSYPIDCYDGLIQEPAGGKPADPGNAEVEASSFMVLATIECGAAGYRAAEFEEQARRRLEAGEQGAAERALWTGLDPDGNSLDILNLQDTAEAIFPSENFDLDAVVGGLEDYAYRDQGYGYTAFIHAPVRVAAYAGASNLIVRDGPLMRTPYGSIWVFGGGYPGTGAGGASTFPNGSYIHITGQVNVWRSSDVHTFPADQTMNRATNQRLLVAEREYAIGFDCLNGRAEFNPIGES